MSKRGQPKTYYSGYRIMWVVVMFDLPSVTKRDRRIYADFRKALKSDGFLMLQESIYARPCPTDEKAKVHRDRLQGQIPVQGEVRVILFTDKQFERQEIFRGNKKVPAEESPRQLSFF